MIYIGIVNGLFFLSFVLQGKSRLRNNAYYLVLIALFLFSAFRFEVGCDWGGYYYQFGDAKNSVLADILENREPIWWGALNILHAYEMPYPLVNVLSSAVFFFGVHRFALRQPDRLAFLILLLPILIINMPMSGIRQGAAIGLVCVALNAFVDRRVVHFAIWIILAAGFHSSALVFLLLLPLATGEYTRRRLILSGIMAIPGALFLASGDSGQIAINRYVSGGDDAVGAVFRLAILMITGMYFLHFLRLPWSMRFPKDFGLASIGSIAMVLAFALLPLSTVIADRFGYYLIPIQCMIYARLPYFMLRNKQFNVAMPYIGLASVFIVWVAFGRLFVRCYLPYQTWLFGFPEYSRYDLIY